ncbi:hypothetical protein KM043_015042 [Ampulex compressa]|nr:hypothetical protein KM043_015042 [Ampulex compressa]
MALTMTEDMGSNIQRGLSEWWSEETEYVFQRIERWAAFARGYNRLRSQRLSRGRMTMQEEQEPRWSISSNKLIIDDISWNPRFHTMKRSRRKCRPSEETKINCCGTFDYQSNSNLDSACLETYRYDHSIYFKTIGDIRSSKRDLSAQQEEEERVSISSEELVEWDAMSMSEFVNSELFEEEMANDNSKRSFESFESLDEDENLNQNAWPIVDLAKLDLNMSNDINVAAQECDDRDVPMIVEGEKECNNNCVENPDKPVSGCQTQISEDSKATLGREGCKTQEGIKRFLSFRKSRRTSRMVKQTPALGENNAVWPGVLLNYTKNVDHSSSPHHHRTIRK